MLPANIFCLDKYFANDVQIKLGTSAEIRVGLHVRVVLSLSDFNVPKESTCFS